MSQKQKETVRNIVGFIKVRSDVCTDQESAGYYHTVIEQIETYRVIPCRDGLQWIIQQRSKKTLAEPRWRSISYCTTRKALIRLWTAQIGKASIALDKLPERIGGEA